VFYISKLVPLFTAIVSFIVTLAESPPIKISNTAKLEKFNAPKTLSQPLDILTILLNTDQNKATLFDQLEKLGKNIGDYLSKLQNWQVQNTWFKNDRMTPFLHGSLL
jgi:hypothetical protein